VPTLEENVPVKIAFIADGEPTTAKMEIREIDSLGATLVSDLTLQAGSKIGLVVRSQDERIQQVFLDAGLVSRPFYELRTQAIVDRSEMGPGDVAATWIRFTGNLRVIDVEGR
jgi:hypothetical protein